MRVSQRLSFLLELAAARGIARRYFIVNGFDGALTLFGIVIGFYGSHDPAAAEHAMRACIGASVALAASGLSSAYLSETAERAKTLRELEQAMVTTLAHTAQGRASRIAPVLIAAANALAPAAVATLVITPLWLAARGVPLPLAPLDAALINACLCLFLLGMYSGRLSGTFWLWAGLRAVLIALATSAAIVLLTT